VTASTRLKEIYTGAAAPLLLMLGFGAGEGVLRVVQAARFGIQHSIESSSGFFLDPRTGLRLPVPNSKQGKIRINSLGFRGPEIAETKSSGTIRIAFLGSSTTYDPYADETSNWPSLTASLLQDASEACTIDFANGGVPGFATDHMRERLERTVAQLQPDIVVILPGGDQADRLASRTGVQSGLHYLPSWLARQSLVWSKLEKNLHIVRLQRAAHSSKGKLHFEPRELSLPFEQSLEALVQSAQKLSRVVAIATISSQLRHEQTESEQIRAANTALFFMPYMSIDGLLQARDEFNRVIREVGRRRGVVVIGGEEDIPGDRLHYVDTAHFTKEGSRRMAERVSQALLADPQVRALLRNCGSSVNPRTEATTSDK
jgi:lysophospholipase L1-like esterase